jgi:hypothetical protein
MALLLLATQEASFNNIHYLYEWSAPSPHPKRATRLHGASTAFLCNVSCKRKSACHRTAFPVSDNFTSSDIRLLVQRVTDHRWTWHFVAYFPTLSVLKLYGVEWEGWWIMNRKESGRKRSWPITRWYSGICLGLIKTTKNLSGYPVIRPRFKPSISQIQIRGATVTPTARFRDEWMARHLIKLLPLQTLFSVEWWGDEHVQRTPHYCKWSIQWSVSRYHIGIWLQDLSKPI